MKTFALFLVVVALAVLSWHQNDLRLAAMAQVGLLTGKLDSQTQEIEALKAKIEALTKPRIPVQAPQRIVCPTCHGERTFAYFMGDSLEKKLQNCPVCLGVGYRPLKVPAGKQICPDCQGMGIVAMPIELGHPLRTVNCGRCSATGVIVQF